MEVEKLVKKQGRLKKQQKKKFSQSSAKLSSQVQRSKTSGGYKKLGKKTVKVKFDK